MYEAHVQFCVRIAVPKCARAFSYGYSLAATPAIAPEHTNAPRAAMGGTHAGEAHARSIARSWMRLRGLLSPSACAGACTRMRYQSSRGTAPSLHGASSATTVRRTRPTGSSVDAAHACSAPRCAHPNVRAQAATHASARWFAALGLRFARNALAHELVLDGRRVRQQPLVRLHSPPQAKRECSRAQCVRATTCADAGEAHL